MKGDRTQDLTNEFQVYSNGLCVYAGNNRERAVSIWRWYRDETGDAKFYRLPPGTRVRVIEHYHGPGRPSKNREATA